MAAFDEHYSDEQRDAIASAWNDKGVRPAVRVAQLALAGELTRPDGSKLAPFGGRDGKPVPEGTVRSLARDERLRRRGETNSELAKAAPRDAVEMLRKRLVSVTDSEIARLERVQVKAPSEPVNAEQVRQLARAVLEIARLPGPTDPRPPSAATRDADGKRGPQATGGLAGALMKDHRGHAGQTAPQTETVPQNDDGPAEAGPDDASPAAFVAAAAAQMT